MKKIDTDSLGFLMHDATRLLRKRFEERAAEHGLSSAQWRLLVHLVRSGPMPQARLAERLEIEPISVSRLVDRMEQAGWVRREADAADRRARMVVATDRTERTFEAVRAVAGDLYAIALDGIDPDTRAALFAGLRRMVANLSGPEDKGCGSAAVKEDAR